MRELWLNNQLCDLDEKTKIAITKQVNTLNELRDRQGDLTNTINLPPTGNNLRITGFPNRVTSDSINPYSKIPARYTENGSELVNGVAFVEPFDGRVNVTLYSGIFNFFDTIGDKSLKDLDFSDCNHIFNLDGVEAGNTSGKYIYPLIQWGAIKNSTDPIDIRYQLPAIPASLIMDKIFEASGYKRSGSIFNTLTQTTSHTESELESFSFNANVRTGANNYYGHLFGYHIVVFNSFIASDEFNSSAGWYDPGVFPVSGGGYSGSRWTCGSSCSGKVSISLSMRAQLLVHPTPYSISINYNGTHKTIASGVFDGINPSLKSFVYDTTMDFNSGDYIEVYVDLPTDNSFQVYAGSFSVKAKNTIVESKNGDPCYNSTYMPIVADSLFKSEEVLKSYSFEAHKTNQVINPGSGAPIIIFNKFDTGSAYDSSIGWYNGWRWSAGNKTSGTIKVRLFMNTPYSPPGSGGVLDLVTISLKINGVYKEIYKRQVHNGDPYNPWTTFIYEEDHDFKIGDWVEVYIQSSYSNTITVLSDGTSFGAPDQYSYFSVVAKNTILLNQQIIINDLIPDIKQRDFIKDIFYQYCIIPDVNYFTKTVNFVQFKEIAEKREPKKRSIWGTILRNSTSKDWSNKLDLSIQPTISYRFEGYGQLNYLNWTQDDDRGENIGRGIIQIDDNTLPATEDIIQTTFAASLAEPNFFGGVGVNIKRFTQVEADPYDNTVLYGSGDKVRYNTYIYTANGDTSGNIPTNATYWTLDEYQFEQKESAAPRLVLLRPLGSSKTYTDGTTSRTISGIQLAYFQDPDQPFDLGFTSIIARNYTDLAHVLKKLKIVTAKFNLKESDIKNLDFFTPVWVGHYGEYFYTNQVSNYINGVLTSVELVRL